MDKYTTIDQVWGIGTRSWSMWRYDSSHSGAGQSGPENLTLRWNFTAGGAVVSSPSVVDKRAYFGSMDKNIYCVDADNGALLWNFTTLSPVLSSPAVVNGKLYTGTDDGNAYCLDAYNGSLIWTAYAGGEVAGNFRSNINLRSSPVVVGDLVYVGALDNKTYAFNATTGDVAWTWQTDGYITSSPAVANDTVYVLSQEPTSGGLYLLNATSGDLITRITVPYQQTIGALTWCHRLPWRTWCFCFQQKSLLRHKRDFSAKYIDLQRRCRRRVITCSPVYNRVKCMLLTSSI